MAENTVDIPVNLDFTQARAALRAFLEESARGFTVPARGGINPAGGGQYAPAPTSVADAEQAAVSRAMAQAQGSYRGGYATGSAPGGGSTNFSPKIDTAGVEAGFREVYQRFESLRQHLERPIRLRVDTSGVGTGMGGGALGAGAAGGGVPWGAASPNYSYLMRQPGGVEGEGDLPAPALAPVQPAPAPGPPPRAWGRLRGGNFLPTSSIRGLFGVLGLHELNSEIGALRQGESDARYAGSAEEAQMARANALQQATSGLFGSAVSLIPNLLDLDISPQRIAREAREGVQDRERRISGLQFASARQLAGMATDSDVARYRTQASIFGIQGSFDRQGAEVRAGTLDFARGLNEKLQDEYNNVIIARRESPYDPKTLDLQQQYQENIINYQRQVGARAESDRAQIGDINRRRLVARRRQLGLTPAYGAEAEGNFGLADEYRFTAGLNSDQSDADEQGAEFGATQRSQNQLRTEARRQALSSQRQTRDAGTLALRARIGRLPVAASDLIGINDDERVALQNVRGQGEDREREISSIRGGAQARREALAQSFVDRQFDAANGLDAAIRQSILRTHGGDANRIRAGLDRIVTDSQSDQRELLRQGDTENAERRRRLGFQQVEESRADFYRSFQFEEVSGDRIASGRRGTFESVGKEFSDARAKAGETVELDKGDNASKLQTTLDRLTTAIEALTRNGVPSRLK